MKLLTLNDVNDYFDDTQLVQMIAYNIKLYEGTMGNIPMMYGKYELVPQKIHVEKQHIVIELDC